MPFELPPLPYARDALEPHISKETLDYHYGKHHQGYVNKLNILVEGTAMAEKSLEDIIMTATGGIFNNAAQIWNHTFYWQCMSPKGGGLPNGELAEVISKTFDSLERFKEEFISAANTHFGSGWTWLVKDNQGKLEILSTANAGNPLTHQKKPLLVCDVWEHAYYIDTRNDRPKYVNNFWELINWDFVDSNFNG